MTFGIKTPLVNIRAAIVSILSGVTGVGPVYNRVRRTDLQADVQAMLTDANGKLAFWFVSLARGNPFSSIRRFPASHSIGTANFELFAYRALDDVNDSENTFHSHVADVMEAFELDANKKLGLDPGHVSNGVVMESGPAQWQTGGHVSMVNTLCHQAVLMLPVLFITEC